MKIGISWAMTKTRKSSICRWVSTTTEPMSGRYRIPSYLFIENYLITRAQIPSAVKEIGEYAFEGCASLVSVSFAEDSPLKEIGQYTFFNCLNLRVVELPAALESIESHAFYNCSSLESIALNKKLSSIGADAFLLCFNLVDSLIITARSP